MKTFIINGVGSESTMVRKDSSAEWCETSPARRNFLKMIGSAAGLATVPTVAAGQSIKSASEAGISATLDDLVSTGEYGKAKRLCEQSGVKHSYSSTPMPSIGSIQGTDGNSSKISVQDAFHHNDSELNVLGWFDRVDSQGQDIYR